LHLSTDFVFDGELNRPYTEEDTAHPLNAYGQSKLGGEVRAWESCDNLVVVRTGWLYAKEGKNFLNTMLRLGKERPQIGVVNDQVGTPTHAADLADCLMAMIIDPDLSSKYGTYHFANEGVCSWFDFAVAIMELAKLNCHVKPITTEEYPTPAERPRYSVLDKRKVKEAFGLEIDEWRISLERIWR
jgi:dTDP-4-dehydrorhamnose reductase